MRHPPRWVAPRPTESTLGLEYHVLPDDPLSALNILREAAGLEPWPAQGGEPQ
jgi:hypothetical protein